MHVELISDADASSDAVTILPIDAAGLEAALAPFSERQRQWVALSGFTGKSGQVCLLQAEDGALRHVLFGVPQPQELQPRMERAPLSFGKLASVLPEGTYRFADPARPDMLTALAFLLEAYHFSRYKVANEEKKLRLVVGDEAARIEAVRLADATSFARDLINTPTNDMGPAELSAAARALAERYQAGFTEIVGDDLIKQNFPLIHAVGRASASAPRLLDLTWGNAALPKITLVGKGVCFDTGGLDIKTGSNMLLMKKDMGGAANVLALAQMIMDADLPVRLRVLIPAVENAIAGNAFRPGDVLPSRLGVSVEIANTDAEGRLVLADALALADEEAPDLLIDMATLTGAARVALGPDLPPFYTHDDGFADELAVRARDMADPVWRMPLWEPYQTMLDSPIADVNHAPASGFAGSVTAALFLARFVKAAQIWAHFDIYAWTPTAQPARPKGGEAQAIRALYALIKARFA